MAGTDRHAFPKGQPFPSPVEAPEGEGIVDFESIEGVPPSAAPRRAAIQPPPEAFAVAARLGLKSSLATLFERFIRRHRSGLPANWSALWEAFIADEIKAISEWRRRRYYTVRAAQARKLGRPAKSPELGVDVFRPEGPKCLFTLRELEKASRKDPPPRRRRTW